MLKFRHLLLSLLLIACCQVNIYSQDNSDFQFFPKDISYDPEFPKPEDILGYNVGEWHVSHDQLVNYMKEMARLSDRITIKETGRTYENRPLLLLTITSPENHGRIEEIRAEHLKLTNPDESASLSVQDMPVVVWLGHSVHGNEPSGANSSLLTVYHWAAAQGDKIDEILQNTVILVDPSINPDGLQRFSTWVNSNKGSVPSGDPNDREHNETWPRGRTNHYWFDLNRDWLPQQHPESQGRMAAYHTWKPNIVTDHHEMGSNSTFFFMPGIPTRNNPLIPQNTNDLTAKIAEYHARELDRIGSFYYARESFDDFYFGKGSTYPDINGAVGILFEQASSRGHVQHTINGELTFPFTIRNHFTTAYSTVLAANGLRTELLENLREFYKSGLDLAKSDPVKAYVWDAGKDEARKNHFLEMLIRNQVDVYNLASDSRYDGKSFDDSNSFVVPLNQKNYRLAKTIFEKRTTFEDSLFYDVSAWTIPLAMNLNYAEIKGKSMPNGVMGQKVTGVNWRQGAVTRSNYAYALRWDDFYSAKVLNRILTKGLIAKVATENFTAGGSTYDRGTIIIPITGQKMESDELFNTLEDAVAGTGVSIEAMATGYTGGVNLGSGSFRPLYDPKVAILTDGGVHSNEPGEVWHLLDYRMKMNVTLLPVNRVSSASLSKYNTLVMTDGNYGSLNAKAIKDWVRQGGVVIAFKRAGKWLADNEISKAAYLKNEKEENKPKLPYALGSRYMGAQVIGGAIFNTRADLTHPLLYSFEQTNVPVFRRGQLFMKSANGSFANPLMYTSNPLLSGYISDDNLAKLANSAALEVGAFGGGRIITFADNPNFRAFWYGTNKLFLNAVFFGSVISGSSTR